MCTRKTVDRMGDRTEVSHHHAGLFTVVAGLFVTESALGQPIFTLQRARYCTE